MRRVVVAFLSAIVAGLMLAPGGVSAGVMKTVAQDSLGDIGFGVDPKTGWIMHEWADNTPVDRAGYFDMVSASFSQKGKIYTFEMEVAAALPEVGSPLPNGIHLAEWAVWFDPSPYNVHTNPVAPLFLIALRYDGSAYGAFVLDYSTMTAVSTPFSVDGTELQIVFTAASIGNLEIPWWSPLVRVWWGPLGSSGYWFVDGVDMGAVPGQDGIDLPWPPQ